MTYGPVFIYSWIRLDLPVYAQIIQHGHAMERASNLAEYRSECPNTCLFEVDDERELIAVQRYLNKHGIEHHCFHERDMGSCGEYTAISTRPVQGAERELFRGFKMYGRPPNVEQLMQIA